MFLMIIFNSDICFDENVFFVKVIITNIKIDLKFYFQLIEFKIK